MTPAMVDALVAMAKADATTTRTEIDALRNFLRGASGEAWARSEPLDRVISPKAAAEILGVSRRSLQMYARRGIIRPVRLGAQGARAVGYSESSLRAALERRG